MLLSNGFKVLIGRNCGEKLFRDSWKEARRSFDAKLSRRSLWGWRDRAKSHLRPVHTRLRYWYPELSTADTALKEFKRFDPSLFEALAASGGELVLYEFSSIEKQFVQIRMGTVNGTSVLSHPEMKKQLTDLRMSVREVIVKLQEVGSHRFSDDKLKSLRKSASLIRVAEISAQYEQARSFFSVGQWPTIARWASAEDSIPGRFSFKNGVLYSPNREYVLPKLKSLDTSATPHIDYVSKGGVAPPEKSWDD